MKQNQKKNILFFLLERETNRRRVDTNYYFYKRQHKEKFQETLPILQSFFTRLGYSGPDYHIMFKDQLDIPFRIVPKCKCNRRRGYILCDTSIRESVRVYLPL